MCVGIPARVVALDSAGPHSATVEVEGVQRAVNTILVDTEEGTEPLAVGDWVLLHVGFAMSRIDADEAAKTLALLTELGEAQAELDALRAGAGA